METKFEQFMRLNKELLDCYGSVDPNVYLLLDESTQKDVCYAQRMKLDEFLTKGKIQSSDFFAAYDRK